MGYAVTGKHVYHFRHYGYRLGRRHRCRVTTTFYRHRRLSINIGYTSDTLGGCYADEMPAYYSPGHHHSAADCRCFPAGRYWGYRVRQLFFCLLAHAQHYHHFSQLHAFFKIYAAIAYHVQIVGVTGYSPARLNMLFTLASAGHDDACGFHHASSRLLPHLFIDRCLSTSPSISIPYSLDTDTVYDNIGAHEVNTVRLSPDATHLHVYHSRFGGADGISTWARPP